MSDRKIRDEANAKFKKALDARKKLSNMEEGEEKEAFKVVASNLEEEARIAAKKTSPVKGGSVSRLGVNFKDKGIHLTKGGKRIVDIRVMYGLNNRRAHQLKLKVHPDCVLNDFFGYKSILYGNDEIIIGLEKEPERIASEHYCSVRIVADKKFKINKNNNSWIEPTLNI